MNVNDSIFSHIIKVSSKNQGWRSEIDDIKLKESLAESDESSLSFIIITTYASFSRESTFKQLMSLSKKIQRQMLLIADEAHNIGAPNIMSKLDRVKILLPYLVYLPPRTSISTIKETRLLCNSLGAMPNIHLSIL